MTSTSPKTHRILLVEDDPDLRYELAALFRDSGFEVREQSDGRKALETLLEETAPDLIVLDLRLPDMDGWEFRAEQKKRRELAHIPVVVISADPSPKAAAIDAARFVQKPFSVDDLMRAVSDVVYELDRRRALDAKVLHSPDDGSEPTGLALVMARDPKLRDRFAARLIDAGLRVREVRDAHEFVVLAAQERPDTVLIQVDPGSSLDHQVSSQIVNEVFGVPMVVAVGDGEGLIAIEAWRDGVCRHLDSPFDGTVVASEMAAASARRVAGEILARENAELRNLASVDPLTGLFNRRFMLHRLRQIRVGARRADSAFAIIMVDLDAFKVLNDRLGHLGGDAVLAHVAQTLDQHLRASDLLGRWGGDEFLVILPNTPAHEAASVVERLSRAVRDTPLPEVAGAERITASFGVCAVHPGQTYSCQQLIQRADEALYKAKRQGLGAMDVGHSND